MWPPAANRAIIVVAYLLRFVYVPPREVTMNEPMEPSCPECQGPVDAMPTLDRRNFIRVVGGSVAALAAGTRTLPAADQAPQKAAKPAEALLQELFAGLNDEQKKSIVLPFDHGKNGIYIAGSESVNAEG